MYDGMSCGHLALDKLGAHITNYYATEIDKYAVQTTQHNFPDTIQLGDAFQVRDDGWSLPGLAVEETVATPTAEAVEEPAEIRQGGDMGTEQKETVDLPLTMEDLERMDGQPVWIDNGRGKNKCYIVNNEYEIYGTVEPCGIDLWGAGTSLSLLVRCGLYRKPPNREESA